MIKCAISGITGRMGREITKHLQDDKDIEILAGVARSVPLDIIEEIPIVQTFKALPSDLDLVIDFSSPVHLDALLDHAIEHKLSLVIGTTGYTDAQIKQIEKAGQSINIFYSANMSIGIALLKSIVQKTAKALDEDFDIEILETHHRLKVDAPSGTALSLGESAAKGRGKKLSDLQIYPHPNRTLRESGSIGFAVQRGGKIAGEHQVRFIGDEEELSFSHRALDRSVFAKGAIKVAKLLKGQSKGFYTMENLFSSQ